MKKVAIFITIFLLCCLFFYVLFAFILAELNPFSWSENERLCMVLCVLGLFVLIIAIRYDLNETL
jgi:Trk-type K+ transport system membrane component